MALVIVGCEASMVRGSLLTLNDLEPAGRRQRDRLEGHRPGQPLGELVAHREDHDMMRPFVVVPPGLP
jgi:hypothetical protein